LAAVNDPRARRGVRHGFVAVLTIGVCAMLPGARSFTAITEWAHDLSPAVRARLGLGRATPSESTIRRTLQAIDAQALDSVVCAWLAARSAAPIRAVRAIAVDGKSARGARSAGRVPDSGAARRARGDERHPLPSHCCGG